MHVLIIKTSSMGDVIHTLPALTDATIAIPNIKFDWVVEPAFQEIPAWHKAVQDVIVFPLRTWRKNLLQSFSAGEIRRFFSALRAEKYDVVIDAQGLIKSSVLARFSKSNVYGGLSAQSARESFASVLYNKKIIVPVNLHAIERTRNLFAGILDYSLSTKRDLDYGVDWQQFASKPVTKPYLFFLHGTTWETKHWPEVYWQELAAIASLHGYDVYMTWATVAQKSRVARLSSKIATIKMLPHLSITEATMYLQGASGVVAVDTGFGHLASALGKPMVSLYGPSDPNKVGVLGANQLNLAARFSCVPCLKKTCACFSDPSEHTVFPPCLARLTPKMVWEKLAEILMISKKI